jgi:NADPH2:quinone reductase
MKAIMMRSAGGIEVLSLQELPEPEPGPGQVLVEVAAAGVNFMDVGVRQGLYWTEMPNPKVIGVEGAGRVLAVGAGVEQFAPGERVAWAYAPHSYAERVVVQADSLVHVPHAIDDRTAAAVMMQGLTASHFATDFYPVQAGDIALVHAAAGGVGRILTQLVKMRGGSVIGRVSRADKVPSARAAGADHVIVDSSAHFAEQVLRLTDGEGVHVVFDGSGAATFDGSVASLRRSGTLCWYGPGLGSPPALELHRLPRSVKVGYAAFYDHVPTPALLRERAGKLFEWIAAGKLLVEIGGAYPLAGAAEAHAALESRKTAGKLLLIP